MKCSNCNKYIDINAYYFRCCDAYVCGYKCSIKRYNYIKSIDPHFCFAHAWNYKNLKHNQYGVYPINPKQMSPVYDMELLNNNSITEIELTFESDTDDETSYNNTTIAIKLKTFGLFWVLNILKFINPD